MNIKEWALEDRPREKLQSYGPKQLTNAELLAILLSTGTKSRSALGLAKDLLAHAKNSLEQLATMEVGTLCQVNGIGRAKAIGIRAALELSNRRRSGSELNKRIKCSMDSYEEICGHFVDLEVEEFWVLFLNRANKVIRKERVGVGGTVSVVVDPKTIFKPAIALMATGVILCHNHPSGNNKPSRSDILVTNKIARAGKDLDIILQDHLIIAGRDYYSFRDEGMLED